MKQAMEYNEQDFWDTMGTNLESPYNLCQFAHPLLKASGRGNIVFISSVAAKIALPGLAIYSASKGKKSLYIYMHSFLLMITNNTLTSITIIICSYSFNLFAGAINQLTKNLACEWAKDNIRVNSVAPWAVKTTIVKPVLLSLLLNYIVFSYIHSLGAQE